jgi:hypothetical protein
MKTKSYLLFLVLFFVCASVNSLNVKLDKAESIFQADETDSCGYHITHEQLRAKKDVYINFNTICDSNTIYVPSGGTVTYAALYKNSTLDEMIANTPSFELMGGDLGKMTLHNQLKGKFFLRYGSCHWGSELWVVIE